MDSKNDAENKSFERPPELGGLHLLERGAGILTALSGRCRENPAWTRRQFNTASARFLGGAALGLVLPACKRKHEKVPPPEPPPPEPETHTEARELSTFLAGTDSTLPMMEVRGKPYDIGMQIGRTFAEDIRKGFEGRKKWWKELKEFADSQPKSLYDAFVAAAKKHTPSVYEELRGWADGSGVPLRDLMILNLKAEYLALKDEADRKSEKQPPGCSTIVINDGKRILVAHNEDGNDAYADHMFLLKVRPEGKTSFLCASYPGILPGNAPWVNDRGLIMTTNFIYSKEVRPGVGRYFLDRLSMESDTLGEALDICKHPERAYAFHHVIASAGDRLAMSLEVTPSQYEQVEIRGVFIHTNHLITPSLSKQAQDLQYVSTSSMTRWNVLARWKKSLPEDLSKAGKDDIMQALSSHEGKPYSPCRHPEGDVRGATLLTALFDLDAGKMRVYKSQPCLGKHHDYDFP